MRLFTSTLLTGLLLSCLVVLPGTQSSAVAQNTFDGQTYLVQKRIPPKHRGSGRRELVGLTDTMPC